ncbi:MAG: HAD family hydrolase [Comamonadaceae bacterium]|nr:MAG: HAD family hydrolase [Comamonadaceae bacterium]
MRRTVLPFTWSLLLTDAGTLPSLRDIDAVIVDLDGTMVDTLGDFTVALNLMLAGLPARDTSQRRVDRSTVERMVGKGSEHLVRAVLAHVSAGVGSEADDAGDGMRAAARFDHAFAAYQKHYDAVNGHHAKVYNGVAQGLENIMRRGLPMACLTNKPLAFARTLLQLKALDGYFRFVFGGDSFDRKKPDPLPLIKTCEALGTAPSRTLMLGDSSNDAQAARRAGCPVVLVTYGYNHGEPIRDVDADGFTDSLADLQWTARQAPPVAILKSCPAGSP